MFVLLALFGFIILPATAEPKDEKPVALSPEQVEQAFVILDALIPPKEKFDMKDAPPNGEVRNADGSQYTFTPNIYVPRFGDAEFPKDFVARLARNHSRVMTQAELHALPKNGEFFYVFEGRSYLPTYFIIRHITAKDPATAEAVVYSGAVGGAVERRILLDRSSGRWTVKEKKVLIYYD